MTGQGSIGERRHRQVRSTGKDPKKTQPERADRGPAESKFLRGGAVIFPKGDARITEHPCSLKEKKIPTSPHTSINVRSDGLKAYCKTRALELLEFQTGREQVWGRWAQGASVCVRSGRHRSGEERTDV